VKKVHFIDCGANIGKAIDWAQKEYKERLVKVDAFEPEYINFSTMLAKFSDRNSINPINKKVTIHTQAVWIENKIKTFYVQYWGSRTGSSLLVDKEQVIIEGQQVPREYHGIEFDFFDKSGNIKAEYTQLLRKDKNGNVFATQNIGAVPGSCCTHTQCIDMSEWIFNNAKEENHNVLKVDIEGAEYKVIDHLLDTGAYKLIDEWLIEFTTKGRVPMSYNQKVIDRFEEVVGDYVDWKEMGEAVLG
jgi:FkbM family methyltransferase